MIYDVTEEIFKHIICYREFEIYFQPIINLDMERPIGYEALLRARFQGELIGTEALFSFVRKNHQEKRLDFIAREEAIRQFSKSELSGMLFLNFEAALLEDYLESIADLVELIQLTGLENGNVVVEINEKHARDNEILVKFVEKIRNEGFLIALDDVGEGYSNLNRIALTKPDIVKLDRSTVSEIDQDFYKREIFRAITGLAAKIGAVVIAEGVERREEIDICVDLGTILFQGYFFSRPVPACCISHSIIKTVCKEVLSQYREKATVEVRKTAKLGKERKKIQTKLSMMLSMARVDQYFDIISPYLEEYKEIECVYVIDNDGKQITRTYFGSQAVIKSTYLFTPAREEDYHIAKPYYYVAIHKQNDIYISESYISSATGNFCKTYSLVFRNMEGTDYVLCLDFSE